MGKRIDMVRIARGLGAERRGRVRAYGGAWGAAQLAAEVGKRFRVPTGGGRPTEPSWTERRLVPLAPQTLRRLSGLARRVSRGRRSLAIAPMQLAGLMLEEIARKLTEESVARLVSKRGN